MRLLLSHLYSNVTFTIPRLYFSNPEVSFLALRYVNKLKDWAADTVVWEVASTICGMDVADDVVEWHLVDRYFHHSTFPSWKAAIKCVCLWLCFSGQSDVFLITLCPCSPPLSLIIFNHPVFVHATDATIAYQRPSKRSQKKSHTRCLQTPISTVSTTGATS